MTTDSATSRGPAADSPARFSVADTFSLCVRKARLNIKRLVDDPRSAAMSADGDYFTFPEGFFDIGNWTSSFFTGMAALGFIQSKDPELLVNLNRMAGLYRSKVNEHAMDTMHDLGFLYSLYSVALYKITGEQGHRATGLRAAEVLAGRFLERGAYIQAWGRMDDKKTAYAGLAIIDCMMNLPLLFWASKETGDSRFYDLAVRHADTTQRLFVRDDGSVCHAYRFDVATGEPIGPDNYCGHAVDSHWARGAAWAIYGFALAYRHTRNVRYLETAAKVARKFLDGLDAEVVPVWDFRLGEREARLRDASAAAIAVCGLQELLRHTPGERAFQEGAQRLLKALLTERYVDFRDSCPGVLRFAQVGDGVGKACNKYTSWGDYYLMEALANELQLGAQFW